MAYPLETRRLVLRHFMERDLETFLAYRNDPEVYRFQGWAIPYERAMGEDFIRAMQNADPYQEGEWFQTALELKSSHALIGDVGIFPMKGYHGQARIGFTLARRYWNKGYAREAVTAVIEHLFSGVNLHRILADCDTENHNSMRLLERLGFRREAHHVESYWLGDRWGDEYVYALLEREWEAQPDRA